MQPSGEVSLIKLSDSRRVIAGEVVNQEYRDIARFPRKSMMIWSMDKIGLGYVSMLIGMLAKYQCSWIVRVKFLDTSYRWY